jgi:hypothetical protein
MKTKVKSMTSSHGESANSEIFSGDSLMGRNAKDGVERG